jgi:nucleoside 2-deoxyribosyltransferase
MKIYIAGSMNRRAYFRKVAAFLNMLGYTITSDWIYSDKQDEDCEEKELREIAYNNLHAIKDSDMLILFTGDSTGGGYNVELGMSIALEKEICVIGEQENIFQSHIKKYEFNTINSLMKFMVSEFLSVTRTPTELKMANRAIQWWENLKGEE